MTVRPRLAGWRRVALALGGGALATMLSAAGCSSTPATPPISGSRLTVYLSDPTGLSPDQQDVVDAEKLAFSKSGGRAGSYRLSLHVVTAARLSDNARAAITDTQTIAYLGEVVPGSSADTIGITNALDILQVSPTDSASALTVSTPAVPGSPGRYYENLTTYGHTFARMVPSTSHEAVALVAEMQSLGVKKLRVQTDGSAYGRALMSAITANASGAGVTLAPTGSSADGLVYAGGDRAAATRALDSAAAADPKLKLFVASALADGQFAAGLAPDAQKQLYASSPGFLPSSLTAAQRGFVTSFRTTYGHAPSTQAVFGYAAMQAVLHVLGQAGSKAGTRSTVVSDFMKLKYADSVLGAYSIDKRGDTSLAGFVIERVRHGRLVPVQARPG